MTVKTSYFPLVGALDLSSAPVSIDAGRSLEAVNYIPGLTGGYQSIAGYERFDGRTAPSSAQFWVVEVADNSAIAAGDALTGDSSGAAGYVLTTSTRNRVVITALNLTFTVGETANSTLINVAESLFSVDTDAEYDTWKALAADYYRSFIAEVPGSGAVRGVFRHLDAVYALRDNVGATECDLYKSSPIGWTKITLPSIVRFNAGVSEIAINDLITDGTSSALVKRVCVTQGAWSGTAEGYLVVEPTLGAGIANGAAIKVGATTKATCTQAQFVLTLQPGGRFEFISNNFTGADGGYSVYGCDGVNTAIEINGSDLVVPLYSSDATNNPKFIQAHKSRLFLGFENGQVHYSVAGEPWNYTVSLGAGQIGLGSEVTGMLPQSGGVLAMTTRRRMFVLQGSSNADFALQVAAETAGAFPYTIQNLSEAYALDDRGVIQLSRTAAFGDFESGSVSRSIQKLIDAKKPYAVASSVIRRYNQYWLFFSDGTGVACYPVTSSKSYDFRVTQLNYGRAMTCICNAEDASGNERILFGSDNGYVYEIEKGTSFDGAAIERFIRLPFNHFKSPRVRKRWRKLILEIEAQGPLTLSVTPDIDYSSPKAATSGTSTLSAYGGGGYWDSSNWDEFSWDAESISEPQIQLTGTGRNIGFLIHSESATTKPYLLQGVIIHYEPRRLDLG